MTRSRNARPVRRAQLSWVARSGLAVAVLAFAVVHASPAQAFWRSTGVVSAVVMTSSEQFVAVTTEPTASRAGLISATNPSATSTSSFSIMAATVVVNTGATILGGDIGVGVGGSITGLDPATTGDLHLGDDMAIDAQSAMEIQWNELAARASDVELTGELGGNTLGPGVYHSAAALSLTGTLTLDAGGDPEATFVLRSAATFSTAPGSTVTLANGAQPSHVFWIVAGDAKTGPNTTICGAVLAHGTITFGDGTWLIGWAASGRSVSLARTTVTDSTTPATAQLPVETPTPQPVESVAPSVSAQPTPVPTTSDAAPAAPAPDEMPVATGVGAAAEPSITAEPTATTSTELAEASGGLRQRPMQVGNLAVLPTSYKVTSAATTPGSRAGATLACRERHPQPA